MYFCGNKGCFEAYCSATALINSYREKIEIEKTGLHEREFIDTYRYNIKICHKFESNGSVSMCNVVEGEGAIIESVDNSFESFEVHYAETFIIPEAVKNFIIRPIGSEVTILRATVK